jgi:hypothetical protein
MKRTDIYVPPERHTSAERRVLGHLEAEFRREGIAAEVRIVDVEPPHRSEEATTVEVRISAQPDLTGSRAGPARVVRVIWYDEVHSAAAWSCLARELQEEGRGQRAGR